MRDHSTSLAGYTVLIVTGDYFSSAELSVRLSALGACVLVVENARRAAAITATTRLDMAFIGFDTGEGRENLRHTLDLHGVPYIVTASSRGLSAGAVTLFGESFNAVHQAFN